MIKLQKKVSEKIIVIIDQAKISQLNTKAQSIKKILKVFIASKYNCLTNMVEKMKRQSIHRLAENTNLRNYMEDI